MSVVGFDFGNQASVVALAQKRGIDVLLNNEAKRETPSVVFFGDRMRSMGSEAASKQNMYPKNTVTQLKRLIGKNFHSLEVQDDLRRLPFTVVGGHNGDCLVHVQYGGQTVSFSPEQLIAMILVDLKKIVFNNTSIGATDCVLAVPSYFNEKERHALLDASRIAGLNCLRILDDTAAVALSYGIFKSDLPENEQLHVVFVDMGHSSLQVCIVALKKGQLKILSSAWDRNLGGRDYDEVLFHYFAQEFKAKTKLDVLSSAKACFRLRANCERTKKMLSANLEAPINVECLMEDTDFSSMITRDRFDELSQALTARVLSPCQRALQDAGIGVDQICSVEVVGSSSRIPSVQKVIEQFFKRPVSRTLNAKECIARGCALQCAMLSPVFKVKEFEIINCQPYGINFSWEKDGITKEALVYERNCPYPSLRELSFCRSEPFMIYSLYAEDPNLLSPSDNRMIANFNVGPFIIPEGADKADLKVRVRINGHGLLEAESAFSVIKEEEEETVVPDTGPSQTTTGDANGTGKDSSTEEKSAPTEKKIKTKKTPIPFNVQKDTGLPANVLNEYFEREGKMAADDRLYEETQEKKNAVESYVYDLRNHLSDILKEYVRDSDYEKITRKLEETEDWLYEEGEDQTKSVYIAKLTELKTLGDPVEMRYTEAEGRPKAVQVLHQLCGTYINMAKSDSPDYTHIEVSEKETVVLECENAITWLEEKLKMQEMMQKTDNPCILITDIHKKQDVIERVCRGIMSKPKPKPKKEESTKDKKTEDSASAETEKPTEEKEKTNEEQEEQKDLPKTPEESEDKSGEHNKNDAMDTTE